MSVVSCPLHLRSTVRVPSRCRTPRRIADFSVATALGDATSFPRATWRFSRTLREDAGSRQEVTHENQIVFARLRSATFADEDFLRAGKNFFLSATVQFICNTLARRRSKPARPYICRLIIFSRFTCPSTWPLLQ